MAKHTNNGKCDKCLEIFNAYPDFYPYLQKWFFSAQEKFPEFHINVAGRGMAAQEAAKLDKSSRADYGKSPHNYNAAIDTFRMLDGNYNLDPDWYNANIKPMLSANLNWYGDPNPRNYKVSLCNRHSKEVNATLDKNEIRYEICGPVIFAHYIKNGIVEIKDVSRKVKCKLPPVSEGKIILFPATNRQIVQEAALLAGYLMWEIPHIEMLDWRQMANNKELILVE